MSRGRMPGAGQYITLMDAINHTEPDCQGDNRYIDDGISTATRAELAAICAACPLLDPCRAYARAARPTGGYWPGAERNRRNG